MWLPPTNLLKNRDNHNLDALLQVRPAVSKTANESGNTRPTTNALPIFHQYRHNIQPLAQPSSLFFLAVFCVPRSSDHPSNHHQSFPASRCAEPSSVYQRHPHSRTGVTSLTTPPWPTVRVMLRPLVCRSCTWCAVRYPSALFLEVVRHLFPIYCLQLQRRPGPASHSPWIIIGASSARCRWISPSSMDIELRYEFQTSKCCPSFHHHHIDGP